MLVKALYLPEPAQRRSSRQMTPSAGKRLFFSDQGVVKTRTLLPGNEAAVFYLHLLQVPPAGAVAG